MGLTQTSSSPAQPLPLATEVMLRVVLLVFHLSLVQGSVGDRLPVYKNTVRSCLNLECGSSAKLEEFSRNRQLYLSLLGWDCQSECQYKSMWKTVEHLNRDEKPIPQFHGKWPFIRVFGIQEPASTVFSIGNGLAQVYFLRQLRRTVPHTVPMYYPGHFQCLVAINAWIWSTAFHARDLAWTEKLDYYCAYSIVLCSLVTSLVRVLAVRNDSLDKRIIAGIAIVIGYVYCKHVYYLHYVHFDYAYNMRMNITTAILSFIVWVLWSLWNIRRQPYLWKAIVCVVTINLCILLEVLDFPPVWWTFDAHSIWHASTIPITFLWTSFFMDDCLYLHNAREKLLKSV
ncbi:post-GPI attachment to proteins factor 3-like [Diadema antillarum]|uniref:post-GPI attachment to proteins factor 3-like n=1 Tax=Diadema antillarum TaxID=105358 RepID=UPI003A8B4514